MAKLNQILAVEKGTKSRNYNDITQIHKTLQNHALLQGISRNYQPKDEDGVQLPPESKFVQVRVSDAIGVITKKMAEMFDVTATKEWANCDAIADVVVDGVTILPNVPVTYLLFLEKQITDLHTMISQFPVLDPGQEWTFDENKAVYVTQPVETVKTNKVQRPIVKYDATPEHPAQTEMISEDIVVGSWSTVHMSGAIPAQTRITMLERAQKLLNAVKEAREAANDKTVTRQTVGENILNYVFSE